MSHRLIGITRPEIAASIEASGGLVGATRLSFVTSLGLAAVLAPMPKPGFFLFQRQRALRELVELQRILEALAAAGPLLPARPSTRLEDEAEAIELIGANAGQLREALQNYGSARQFQVTVRWDAAAMVAAIKDRADVVTAIARAAPQGRMAAGKILQDIMLTERANVAREIWARLSSVAREILAMPQDGDDCVANLVVLIAKDAESALDVALSELDLMLPGDSRIRCVGPLPALSFAAVSLERIDPDRIDAAQRLLRVGHRLTSESVRTAWRAYARTHHPDAGCATDSGEFADAATAHQLLRRFVEETERAGYAPALFVDITGQADAGRRAA
jgi:hypothetical protein